jgi:hypothetical protein
MRRLSMGEGDLQHSFGTGAPNSRLRISEAARPAKHAALPSLPPPTLARTKACTRNHIHYHSVCSGHLTSWMSNVAPLAASTSASQGRVSALNTIFHPSPSAAPWGPARHSPKACAQCLTRTLSNRARPRLSRTPCTAALASSVTCTAQHAQRRMVHCMLERSTNYRKEAWPLLQQKAQPR